ncbi:MAG: hypothetical protein QM433_10485 [Euryarchaeota archaeon]|jgi:hypothetical protein|nr:hypothetical protein [Euryarchaeota archaeon]
MAKMTTVQISEETRERLKNYGRLGDTYDVAICNIMDRIEELESKERGSKNPREALAAPLSI